MEKGITKPSILVVADDFTGANDAGVSLAQVGHTVDVAFATLKRRTKNAKAFHDKCENFSFRASNETAVLITAFYSLHGDHLGYG
ncbi:four-carbon acid sugar kinase family protein [Escherichia coli]